MSEDPIQRVYAHAKGLAEGLTKDSRAVEELITISGGDRRLLEEARGRLEGEVAAAEVQPGEAARGAEMAADSDGPAAPTLLAARLLTDAIEGLGGEGPSRPDAGL